MTTQEFEAVRPLLNISDDRINAARSALVAGQTLQGVANIYGWSRQAVGDAVRVVWNTFEKYHESQRAAASAGMVLPPGWEQVTLIAPSALIAEFRQQIAQAVPVTKKTVEKNAKTVGKTVVKKAVKKAAASTKTLAPKSP